jgi:CBS domain containing-hemolysin-like protein
MVALTPLSLIFGGWSKLVMKVFKSEDVNTVTEEELITIVDEAEEDGTIESDEGDLIRSAIEFNDVSAGDILTPRVDIFALSKDSTIDEIADAFTKSAFSRFPVYGEDMDDIVGILHEKDFFVAYHNDETNIAEYIQKPVYVSEHIKVADLLQVLKSKKTHMAIVVDEYGGTMGLVTMEDIIEELIGDVFDEHDEVTEDDYVELPDGRFKVQCSADLDDFFEKFEVEVEDPDNQPQTLNGWVMKMLEKLPEKGDSFTYKNILIEVTSISEKRVEEVHVTVLELEEEEVK